MSVNNYNEIAFKDNTGNIHKLDVKQIISDNTDSLKKATTTNYGITQLTNTIDSTENLALTPKAVNTALLEGRVKYVTEDPTDEEVNLNNILYVKRLDGLDITCSEDLIDTVRSKLNSKYYNLIEYINIYNYFTSSLDIQFNGDDFHQNLLNDFITHFDLYKDPEKNTLIILDFSNKPHEVTLDNLKTILEELIKNKISLYKQYVDYYQQIIAGNLSISIKFNMSDFR